MAWKMEASFGPDDGATKTFENLEDGYDWLRQNGRIDYLERPAQGFKVNEPDFKQFGTGYFWVAFSRVV